MLSKKELRSRYNLLRELEHMAIQYGKPIELVGKQIKKEIRDTYKEQSRQLEEPQPHYNDEYGESCWYKEWFSEPFTEEEKREWIEDHWITINSPYDCTGKWFTQSIQIFNVNTSFGAKSVVYYYMGRDV